MSHNHSHCHDEHNHEGHDHDHTHDDEDIGFQWSLFSFIDTAGLKCLNEAELDSAQNVFKSWDQRLETTKFVESDADEELLFHIPFSGDITLKSIMIIGEPEGASPSNIKLFKNREDLDFDSVPDAHSTQEIELTEDFKGEIEYPLRTAKFTNTHSLDIYVNSNFGADTTKIYYIGLKGDFKNIKREAVVAIYESKPMVADHKQDLQNDISKQIQ